MYAEGARDQPRFIHRKTHFSDFSQCSVHTGGVAIVSACYPAVVTAHVGLILSNSWSLLYAYIHIWRMRLGFFPDRIYFELETNAGQALAGFAVDSLLKIVSLQFLAWPFWPSSVMGRRFQHVWVDSRCDRASPNCFIVSAEWWHIKAQSCCFEQKKFPLSCCFGKFIVLLMSLRRHGDLLMQKFYEALSFRNADVRKLIWWIFLIIFPHTHVHGVPSLRVTCCIKNKCLPLFWIISPRLALWLWIKNTLAPQFSSFEIPRITEGNVWGFCIFFTW